MKAQLNDKTRLTITWTIEDIKERAETIGLGNITEDEATQVLMYMHCNYMAYEQKIGVSWDSVDVGLLNILQMILKRESKL